MTPCYYKIVQQANMLLSYNISCDLSNVFTLGKSAFVKQGKK